MVRAMVPSHGLLSGARLNRGEPIPSDQLIDGTLWVMEQVEAPAPELLMLLDAYEAELATTEDL